MVEELHHQHSNGKRRKINFQTKFSNQKISKTFRSNSEWPSCIQLSSSGQIVATHVGPSVSPYPMPSSSTCCSTISITNPTKAKDWRQQNWRTVRQTARPTDTQTATSITITSNVKTKSLRKIIKITFLSLLISETV